MEPSLAVIPAMYASRKKLLRAYMIPFSSTVIPFHIPLHPWKWLLELRNLVAPSTISSEPSDNMIVELNRLKLLSIVKLPHTRIFASFRYPGKPEVDNAPALVLTLEPTM